MPRKDPITGCEVMTELEFWTLEAKNEGKGREPWELVQEMSDELDAECRREEEKFKDPGVVLGLLAACIAELNGCEPEDPIPMPVAVVSVLEVHVTQSLREDAVKLRAVCHRTDGSEGVVNYSRWYWSGTRLEPPEGDCEVFWE